MPVVSLEYNDNRFEGSWSDETGFSIASAGDFNGDGIEDYIIGTPGDPTRDAVILFGSQRTSTAININGVAGDLGKLVFGNLDFNGDGYGDTVLGSPSAGGGAGSAYIVLGANNPANVDLGTSPHVVTVHGAAGDGLGDALAAGDINGDGIDDLIVGAAESGGGAGGVYVVFGGAGDGGAVDAGTLTPAQGFRIGGASAGDAAGTSVASGDFNGDGIADLLIGAPGSDAGGTGSGAAWLLFGGALGAATLGTPAPGAGLTIVGGEGDRVGDAVTFAGDVNADGFEDILLTAGEDSGTPTAYLLFGKASGFGTIDLAALAPSDGFRIEGVTGRISIAGGGDVNGDGFDDFAIGAEDTRYGDGYGEYDYDTGTYGPAYPGAAYVIYGHAGGFHDLDVTALADAEGYMIAGATHGDQVGHSVALLDPSGDGFSEVLVGAPGFERDGYRTFYYHWGEWEPDEYIPPHNGGAVYTVYSHLPYEDLVRVGTDAGQMLAGGYGSDKLYGRGGDDLLSGNAGANLLYGGTGDDTYIVRDARDKVYELAGEGNDTVLSYVTYAITGQYIETLRLMGGAALNARGNSLDNVLIGNTGDNLLNGDTGADQMRGRKGNDTYLVDNAGDRVFELDGEGTDTVQSMVTFSIAGQYVEDLVLTGSGAIAGTGNGLANHITGNAAANTLIGGGGNDRLDGGAGADVMRGGLGNDLFIVDNSGDQVLELDGEGSDTVEASASFSLAGQYVETLRLTGTANINATGSGIANTLTGNNGNNRLDGGGGADAMAGGMGDDIYVVDNAGDIVTELASQGYDTVESAVTFTIAGQHVEALTLTGSAAINGTGNGLDNVITGNGAANILSGGGGNDRLDGGAGADKLVGGAGDDTYVVDTAGDQVVESNGEGTDTVEARVSFNLAGQYIEILKLTGTGNIDGTGNGQANTLFGNSGANALNGAAGDDALHGGLGADTLTGGTGLDSYWFETALGASNVDRITDFVAADDTIVLDRTIFAGIAADGALAATAFVQATAAQDADDRIVYDKATGKIWYDADGSGAGAAILFAQVAANTNLSAADFLAVP